MPCWSWEPECLLTSLVPGCQFEHTPIHNLWGVCLEHMLFEKKALECSRCQARGQGMPQNHNQNRVVGGRQVVDDARRVGRDKDQDGWIHDLLADLHTMVQLAQPPGPAPTTPVLLSAPLQKVPLSPATPQQPLQGPNETISPTESVSAATAGTRIHARLISGGFSSASRN